MLTGRLCHGQPHSAQHPSPPALIGVRQAALCGRLSCQSAGSHSRGRRTAPCGAGGGGAAAAERRRGTWLHLQPAQLRAEAGKAPAPVGAAPLLGGRGIREGSAGPGPGSPAARDSDTWRPGLGRRRCASAPGASGRTRGASAGGAPGARNTLLRASPAAAGSRRSPALRGKAVPARSAAWAGACQGCVPLWGRRSRFQHFQGGWMEGARAAPRPARDAWDQPGCPGRRRLVKGTTFVWEWAAAPSGSPGPWSVTGCPSRPARLTCPGHGEHPAGTGAGPPSLSLQLRWLAGCISVTMIFFSLLVF